MKSVEEIIKLREAKTKENEERLNVMKAKENELREIAKKKGLKFAAEVNLDSYVDGLINSKSITIDMDKFAEKHPDYKAYDSVNRIDEMRYLVEGIIEGITKRFKDNGFVFTHDTNYSGLVYTLSI